MSYTTQNIHCTKKLRENEVIEFLKKCQLDQYAPIFFEEGFDTMEAVYEITEEDLIALNVKRGHRRLIQREIATLNGIPKHQPLIVNSIPPQVDPSTRLLFPSRHPPFYYKKISETANKKDMSGESSSGYGSMQSSSSFINNANNNGKTSFDEYEEDGTSSSDQSLHGYTRKYKRHPKPDIHAPVKPPSAYVMFSNDSRAQLKDHNLSFAEIAKIVGEQWKKLDPREKQVYECNAMRAKDEYIDALNRYKQTPEYRKYQAYLADFKSKQDEENKRIMRQRKRVKMNSPSSNSITKWQHG
ncbi:hypothetical protein RMCBS344292_06297 [Rhizopus microsporus]|nr:hypothetical protein RMCBS344292_06297 [Rhizopus microsporus]